MGGKGADHRRRAVGHGGHRPGHGGGDVPGGRVRHADDRPAPDSHAQVCHAGGRPGQQPPPLHGSGQRPVPRAAGGLPPGAQCPDHGQPHYIPRRRLCQL